MSEMLDNMQLVKPHKWAFDCKIVFTDLNPELFYSAKKFFFPIGKNLNFSKIAKII